MAVRLWVARVDRDRSPSSQEGERFACGAPGTGRCTGCLTRPVPISSERATRRRSNRAKRKERTNTLRKGTPANIPLPRTLKWADELPPRVKPAAPMRHFPRIANMIAAAWDDLVQFETYTKFTLDR
jgi:hypothetical protein